MTNIAITHHRPVYRGDELISGTFTLSTGHRGGYLTAKDGEICLHLEKPEGGFVSAAQGYYRTSDPIRAIKDCCILVLGAHQVDVLTETQKLVDDAMALAEEIGPNSLNFRDVAKANAHRDGLFIGTEFGSKADWCITLDHEVSGVAVNVRSYDGKLRTTFEHSVQGKMSRADAEEQIVYEVRRAAEKAEAERAHRAKQLSLNELARNGYSGGDLSFEEWDVARREAYAKHDGDAAIEGVEVEHYEHETVVYLSQPELGGQVVASWCSATGTCRIKAPRQAAIDIAAGLSNLISNSLQHGWGEV